jgi:short-subunit dehydrogenase
MAADARDPEAHRAVAARARELGSLHTWVNNAGVVRTTKAWEHPDADVDLMVDVNLRGLIHGSRAAVEAMRESGGHILNLASMSSFGAIPGLAVYAATKAGVLNFTTSLQGDLDRAGIPIRVHALCPDAADTPMVQEVRGEPDSAILFSGGSLLDADRVADEAMGLLEGRRLVRAFPAYRAALIKSASFTPRAGLRITHLLARVGERRR